MSDDLRTRTWRLLEAHGLGWIDNGKPDIARCYCGYRPQLGESWHHHVADAVIRELGLTKQFLVDGIISDGQPRPWEIPCETRYATEWERFDE